MLIVLAQNVQNVQTSDKTKVSMSCLLIDRCVQKQILQIEE